MALGATTYKTPHIINLIGSDLTDKEGCGVTLPAGVANQVDLATDNVACPYGIVVTGTDSVTPGTYPSSIGNASLELVDQLGCVVQVLINSTNAVAVGDFLVIDPANADGSFDSTAFVVLVAGEWVWGLALTAADPGEQCLMRFQPSQVQ